MYPDITKNISTPRKPDLKIPKIWLSKTSMIEIPLNPSKWDNLGDKVELLTFKLSSSKGNRHDGLN